ncbi:MAG TPA: lysylphosphatidylglycerol synthase transmembrane domain-containing protein [Ramlibacter sp.]|nr:lysylphosphatidylglycerol synthase transmembrane domain-containing protein [Ramlibacter sp.]
MRHLKLLAAAAVSVAALVLLLRGVDRDALLQAWTPLTSGGVLLALAFLAAGYALRIVRWWWMLAASLPSLRVRDCATPFLAGIALNNVLPLRAGDAVRAFGFASRLRLPMATVAGSVLLERLLDLAALLAVFVAGAALLAEGRLPAGVLQGALWLSAAAALVLLALAFAVPRWAAGRVDAEGGWRARARSVLAQLVDSFRLLRSGRDLGVLVALTALVWALEGAAFVVVAAELAPQVPAVAGWFTMATGTLATLLPSTPGYVGTFDYFTALALRAFEVAPPAAAAFALCIHALLWVPVTVVGLSLLALHGGRRALAARGPGEVAA